MATLKEIQAKAKRRKENEQVQQKKQDAQSTQLSDIMGNARARAARDVNENYISTFLRDSDNFITQAQSDYKGLTWESATNSEANSTRENTAADLQARARKIRAYYSLNKDSMDEAAYADILGYLDNTDKLYGEITTGFAQAEKVYSQYESQDHYDVMNMSTDALKAEIDKGESDVAYTTKDGTNLTWQQLYDNAVLQKDLEDRSKKYSANSDWAEYGRSDYTTADMESDFQTVYGLAIDNTPATWQEAQRGGMSWEQFKTVDDQRKYISEKYGVDPTDVDRMNDLTNNLNEISQYVDHMTDQEKSVLNYMFRTEGAEKAVEWFASRRYIYEERMAGKVSAEMADYSKDNPLMGSLLSLGNTLLSPIEYYADTLRYADTDEKYYNMSAQASSALKSGVMDEYDWKTGDIDWFDFLYGTTMSGAESTAAMLTSGPFAGLSLGMSAAAQTTNDAFARGMDKKSAVRTGIAAGVAEMLSESFSIGNFNALKEIPSAHIKDIAFNIGKSMLVNASEETLTELANLVYDDIANGDFSQWETNYRQRIANGETPSEARAHAWGDSALQVGEATASGALMGIGFGATGSGNAILYNASEAINTAGNTRAAVQDIIQTEGGVEKLQALAEEAMGLPEAGLQGKLEKQSAKVTEKATAGNVRSLYKTVGKAFNAQNQADITQSLESKGIEAKDAKALATAIVADSNGKMLTDKQSNLLDKYSTNTAVQTTISSMVMNDSSTLNQRKAVLADLGGKNTLTRAFMQKGVSKAVAEKFAEVVVAAESGQKLPTEAQDLLDSVQQNPKLSEVIQQATTSMNITAEEAFNSMAEDYAGSNNVIANMSQPTRDAFLKIYDPNVNTSGGEYAGAMATAYSLGYNNQAIGDLTEMADGTVLASLTEVQRQFAWKQGREAAEHDTRKAQENVEATYKKAQEVLKQKGQAGSQKYHAVTAKGISEKTMDKQQRASYQLAKQIAPAVKAYIVAYDGGTEWGHYDHKNDTVHINVNAKWNSATMMVYTMSHELAHRAKKGSPAQFKAFADFLIEQYGKQGADIDKMIAEQLEAAKRAGIEMTEDEAFEEVIADACQRMLLDTNAGQKLAEWGARSQQNKNFLTKLKQIITDLLNRLSAYFKNVEPDSLAAKEFAKIDANAKQILADMFVDMSIDAGEKLSTIKAAGMSIKNTATEGGRQYKLSPNAKKEVKNALADKNYSLEVKLTDSSPSILLAQKGVRNLPMLMNASHIRENVFTEAEAKSKGLRTGPNINYHGLGETLFLEVIDGLDDVTEAYRGTKNADDPSRREKYFLLVSKYTDKNGDIINVPVYINEKGIYNKVFIDTNKVATVYGKIEFRKYIQTQISKGNLVRIKKRSTQASESTSPINADYGENASKDSIRNDGEIVKGKVSNKLPVGEFGIDKMNSNEENGVTQNTTRGGHHDNRGVREGTAETAESREHNRGTASRGSTNAQTVQGWENLSQEVQQQVRSVVADHIDASPNSSELFYYIISLVDETDETITAEAYDQAVDLLTESLFDDAQNLHPVLFESKWSLMGGSISNLRREMLNKADKKQFKLPVGEDISPRAVLANALEGAAQTDAERQKLQEYKDAIDSLNELEEHLHEVKGQIKKMSFAKGPRDRQKLADLRGDATRTENRINLMDKRLLRMEAANPSRMYWIEKSRESPSEKSRRAGMRCGNTGRRPPRPGKSGKQLKNCRSWCWIHPSGCPILQRRMSNVRIF